MPNSTVNVAIKDVEDAGKIFQIMYQLLTVGQFPGAAAAEVALCRRFLESAIKDNEAFLSEFEDFLSEFEEIDKVPTTAGENHGNPVSQT